MFDALGNLDVGHPQRPAQAGHIGEAFVYGVLFHLRRIAPHNGKEARGQQAVGLIVGGQDHRLWADFPDLREPHPTPHPTCFGLIAHRGRDAALFAGDDGPPLQLWAAGLLAGGKERIAINVQDGTRQGLEGEWRRHG